jgi:hypothetical protein
MDSISDQNKRENTTPDSRLEIKDKIRLIEPRKARYNVSQYYCTIHELSDKSIIIIAATGSVKTVTRSHIIPAGTGTKIKEAKSIGDNGYRCSVIERLKYYPRTDSEKVKFFEEKDNSFYIDKFKAKKFRTNKVLEYSEIEFEFFKNSAGYH